MDVCQHLCLTPTGVGKLGPLDEAEVPGPGPQCVWISEAEFGVKVVSLQTLLSVDGVVTRGRVRTVYPDLTDTQSKV